MIGFCVTLICISLLIVAIWNDKPFVSYVIAVIVFTGGILVGSFIKTGPSAMDVYEGNTTLKYVVIDGVAVDSTVIYKKQ